MADRKQSESRGAWATFWHNLFHDDEANKLNENLSSARASDCATYWRSLGEDRGSNYRNAWESIVRTEMKKFEDGADALPLLFSPRTDDLGMIEKEAAFRMVVTGGMYRDLLISLAGTSRQAQQLRENFGFSSIAQANYFLTTTYCGSRGPWVMRDLIIHLLGRSRNRRLTPALTTAEFIGEAAKKSGDYQWMNLVRNNAENRRREFTPLVNTPANPLPAGEKSQVEIVAMRIAQISGMKLATTISTDVIVWTDNLGRTRLTPHWIEVCRSYPGVMESMLTFQRQMSSFIRDALLDNKTLINHLAPQLTGLWP